MGVNSLQRKPPGIVTAVIRSVRSENERSKFKKNKEGRCLDGTFFHC